MAADGDNVRLAVEIFLGAVGIVVALAQGYIAWNQFRLQEIVTDLQLKQLVLQDSAFKLQTPPYIEVALRPDWGFDISNTGGHAKSVGYGLIQYVVAPTPQNYECRQKISELWLHDYTAHSTGSIYKVIMPDRIKSIISSNADVWLYIKTIAKNLDDKEFTYYHLIRWRQGVTRLTQYEWENVEEQDKEALKLPVIDIENDTSFMEKISAILSRKMPDDNCRPAKIGRHPNAIYFGLNYK